MSLVTIPAGWKSQDYFSIDTANAGPGGAATVPNTASGWPTQFLAVYVPIRVRHRVVAKKLFVVHASTGTGNFDVGIYDSAGTRLVSSGSTAKTAAAACKVIDTTDTTLGPGLFYMALSVDTVTDTYYVDNDAVPSYAAMGLLTETLGSVTLPASATWAVNQTLAVYPYIGFLVETTVT